MDPSSSSSSSKRKRDLDCYDEPRYKRPKFDVFVNYAPDDIGNGFASHLKGALGREGFTICDHTKLPKGQDESSELLKAIEDSEIYLLVFSDKYASSVRCLEEFAYIMESYPKFKHRKVLPVFFNVEPTDVKNQQGPFFDAFKDHETKLDPNRVQIWRQAFREAGHLSGLPFQNGRDEAELVHNIVKEVLNMQNPQQLCNVNHLVGIESRAQDIISALRLGEETFTILAVLGFSGTGKTVAVKAVYDMIAPEFDASCFIQNIRGYTNREADLQKDVITYLSGNDTFIARHNDGASKIRKLMSIRKTLLVLDDVGDSDQLEALITDSTSFHHRSRIIVTTINRESLSCLRSNYTPYNTKLLDDSESFQLFTGLTFGEQDTVEKNFVDEIVQCAGGIPLVLEVWSRYFTDHDRKHWPSMLETLKRIPHNKTQKKFRIIYDLLPKRTQKLFLDIACFFDGWHKGSVIKILQEEDFSPEVEIQNLVHKFLVKDTEGQVSLHDVIKKMGQEVVRQEDEDEPGKRTRLMGYDVFRVLGDCSGTDSVRSIKVSIWEIKEQGTVQLGPLSEAFKKMSNLRFIKWNDYPFPPLQCPCLCRCSNDYMSTCFSLKHLKYLEWDGFPYKSLDNFGMGNVVVIKLKYNGLEKLWEGASKSLKKLKILDVSKSRSLTKTGSFIGLENLEELDLERCENLEELDGSIGCLKKLVVLNLTSCKNLVNLPSNISELQNLETLRLNGSLKLGSEGFTQVTGLRNLQKLEIGNCNVSQVSSGIGNLVSLVILDLSANTFSSLPETFSNLSKLERLIIHDCYQLRLLPPLPSQLKEIQANECRSLDVMPFDSMQKAYIFRSKAFKESSLTSSEGLYIGLSGEEVPEWCTYRNCGNVLSFVAPIQFDSKICGLILCATRDKYVGMDEWWVHPVIYNITKGTTHEFEDDEYEDDEYEDHKYDNYRFEGWVKFYPFDCTTLVVEAGDTVEVDLSSNFKSCGLRWVYEDDVVDSGLVFKDVRNPTLSLFPLSSEIMTGNSITELNDEELFPFPIPDGYLSLLYSPVAS